MQQHFPVSKRLNFQSAFHADILFKEFNGIFLDIADTEANAKLVVDLKVGAIREVDVVEALRKRVMRATPG